ncbi:hypothetical protein DFH08DRAFT_1044222 [Mycena albidolilacea]|uniref:Uncharacterized protein n=1 Tax=Mycena albidolilacea TaxID=1033008 RepID=A0AAD6Z8X0_9AGAR|nr:hypothetical protein DFH08DRAFT_1044222 [Mycena albidolilacea]
MDTTRLRRRPLPTSACRDMPNQARDRNVQPGPAWIKPLTHARGASRSLTAGTLVPSSWGWYCLNGRRIRRNMWSRRSSAVSGLDFGPRRGGSELRLGGKAYGGRDGYWPFEVSAPCMRQSIYSSPVRSAYISSQCMVGIGKIIGLEPVPVFDGSTAGTDLFGPMLDLCGLIDALGRYVQWLHLPLSHASPHLPAHKTSQLVLISYDADQAMPGSPQKFDSNSHYSRGSASTENELAEYFCLTTVPEPWSVEICCKWWYSRRKQFPNLYLLVWNILCIPGAHYILVLIPS